MLIREIWSKFWYCVDNWNKNDYFYILLIIEILLHRLFSLIWTLSVRLRRTRPLQSGDKNHQMIIRILRWMIILRSLWLDFWLVLWMIIVRWFREGSTEPITNNQHYQISHFAHDDEYVDTILRYMMMMLIMDDHDDFSGWSQLRRSSMVTTSVKQKTDSTAPMEK